MSNTTNNHDERDTVMENMLDLLAREDRTEPDAGFEDRIWHAMHQATETRISGRRRKKSTAWIPFVTAACVGVMGYIVWMPMINVDLETNDQTVAVVLDDDFSADILLSSFDAMDMLIADAEEVDESLSMLELQIDTNEFEVSVDSTWQDLGGSL